MEYALAILYLIFISIHGFFFILLCKILLLFTDTTILNKVHVSLSIAVVFPILIGDVMILISCMSRDVNLHNLAPIFDYCGTFTYQTLFQHYFQYRSSMLYKGIAHRFHHFVVICIIIKAIATPIFSILGLVLSQRWGYQVEIYITMFQIVASATNFGFNNLIMRKLLSLNLIQANRRSFVSVLVFPKRYSKTESIPTQIQEDLAQSLAKQEQSTNDTSVNDIYNRVKSDIYSNIKRTLITAILYIIVAVTLVGVFNDNTPRSGFFTSMAYRIMVTPAVIATNSPIWKAYKELKHAAKDQTGSRKINSADELAA